MLNEIGFFLQYKYKLSAAAQQNLKRIFIKIQTRPGFDMVKV